MLLAAPSTGLETTKRQTRKHQLLKSRREYGTRNPPTPHLTRLIIKELASGSVLQSLHIGSLFSTSQWFSIPLQWILFSLPLPRCSCQLGNSNVQFTYNLPVTSQHLYPLSSPLLVLGLIDNLRMRIVWQSLINPAIPHYSQVICFTICSGHGAFRD